MSQPIIYSSIATFQNNTWVVVAHSPKQLVLKNAIEKALKNVNSGGKQMRSFESNEWVFGVYEDLK